MNPIARFLLFVSGLVGSVIAGTAFAFAASSFLGCTGTAEDCVELTACAFAICLTAVIAAMTWHREGESGDERRMSRRPADACDRRGPDGRQDFLYHSTPVQNLESVLAEGLRPSGLGMVYLSERPDSWRREGDALLRVDIRGIGLRLSTFGDPRLDEILCWGRVPPERITVLDADRPLS